MQIKQVQLKLPGFIVTSLKKKKKSPKCCQNIFFFESSCRQPIPLRSPFYFLSMHSPNNHRWSLNEYKQRSITDIQGQYSALRIAVIACGCTYVFSEDISSSAAACGSRICFRHTTAAAVQAHVCPVLFCRRSSFLKGQERDWSPFWKSLLPVCRPTGCIVDKTPFRAPVSQCRLTAWR